MIGTCSEKEGLPLKRLALQVACQKGNRAPHSPLSHLTRQEILGVLDTR